MRTLFGLLLALASAAAVAAPQDEAIAIVDRWAAAFAASDVDGIVALYAPDATFIGTTSTSVLEGHAAIRRYFENALLADRPRGAALRERSVIEVSPSEVVVAGLDVTSRTRAGVSSEAPGRVTFVLAKRGDAWQIVHFHRSALPATPR